MNRADFRLRAQFRHALRQAAIPDGARLLVAVSGGADSVALLLLCRAEAEARGWQLTVGHLDHRLRPDSGDDAAWVRSLAVSLGLPCRVLRVRRGRMAEIAGGSIEAAARRLRRRALHRIADRVGAERILLGHTRDDQAETVLLHLLRGTGLRGLGGISPVRGRWIRPLLALSRTDLRRFLQRSGQEWREDPSNDDPRFLRNRIRTRLLPLLRAEFQPAVDAVLARSAQATREAGRLLREQTDLAWQDVCREAGPGRIRLDRLRLASYHPAVLEEVLRRAYVRLRGTSRDLAQAHLVTLPRLVRSGRGGVWRLPGGIEASLDRREIRLTHPTQEQEGRDTGAPSEA